MDVSEVSYLEGEEVGWWTEMMVREWKNLMVAQKVAKTVESKVSKLADKWVTRMANKRVGAQVLTTVVLMGDRWAVEKTEYLAVELVGMWVVWKAQIKVDTTAGKMAMLMVADQVASKADQWGFMLDNKIIDLYVII